LVFKGAVGSDVSITVNSSLDDAYLITLFLLLLLLLLARLLASPLFSPPLG